MYCALPLMRTSSAIPTISRLELRSRIGRQPIPMATDSWSIMRKPCCLSPSLKHTHGPLEDGAAPLPRWPCPRHRP